eukprot:TRINITY_DN801_c0_g1_i1.p1 TRINITY_DN801_c0_g1~~TRINITY_DN801_c0_g1_i1.p1  ORF type:complete len:597 (+),score=169.39 TRINITY_DN801_c0_g1_i1:113-1903(+)
MSGRTMRCYYEVLEVERDATDSEVKKSYYKLARAYHPDKNPDNQEEATLKFKEISAAWEVLSDPQEKAWYDSHREQILRGEDEYEGGVNLWPYFSRMAYDGFDDSDTGYFTVFRTVFEQLAAEEAKMGTKQTAVEYPTFGAADSAYSGVRQFYSVWGMFASSQSFSWKDLYKTTEAPNRQVRRLMEKENKKARSTAKRKFNEVVRKLVGHMKKADPRVKAEMQREAHRTAEMLKLQEEEKRLKAEFDAVRREELRQAQEKMLSEVDFAEMNLEWSSSSEEKSHYYCAPCRKPFKSEQAWKNHENSKKHKATLLKLQAEVALDADLEAMLFARELDRQRELDEDEELEMNSDELGFSPTSADSDSDSLAGEDTPVPTVDEGLVDSQSFSDSLEEMDEELLALLREAEARKEKKKKKKKKKGMMKQFSEREALWEDSSAPEAQEEREQGLEQEQEQEQEQEDEQVQVAAADTVDPEQQPGAAEKEEEEVVEKKEQEKKDDLVAEENEMGEGEGEDKTPSPLAVVTGTPSLAFSEPPNRGPKKKRRRAKKADREAAAAAIAAGETPAISGFRCETCGNRFNTKNQLHKHLKKKNHATIK